MRECRHIPILLLLLAATAPGASAIKVGDITRISGHRSYVITGLGLVCGLKGTGDGGDFLPAIRPLAAVLENFADPSTVKELSNVQNVAVVGVVATIPPDGATEGDKLDVYVTSFGAATSLRSGRLFPAPLMLPLPGKEKFIYAMAEGPVLIEDPSTPTCGVVKMGGVVEAPFQPTAVQDNHLTLVINAPAANWATASAIATIINDAEGTRKDEVLAIARDSKTVVVTIPAAERERPDSFIARIQALPVRTLPTEARVVINNKTKTMVITGDVEISPVVISHNGLTIQTVNPPPTPTPARPVVSSQGMVSIDTTQTGGAKLQDLVNALDQLKVPAEDRIIIMQELYKTGKLHAQLIVE